MAAFTWPLMQATARFDERRRYRYRLTRRWAAGPAVCFCLLNPSTADETKLDPTVRRCLGFALGWGWPALEVVNLFAWRSTKPDVLRTVRDPVGPENDRAIHEAASESGLVIAAWGNAGTQGDRAAAVLALLRAVGSEVRLLRVTAKGQPEHPLYLPKRLKPRRLG